MKTIKLFFSITILLTFISCSNTPESDAYGNFEAVELTIAAEGQGNITSFNIEEGDLLQANQQIGTIDTTELYLQKKQLLAQRAAIESKMPNIATQINVLKQQLKKAEFEQQRTTRLVRKQAATKKQLDDLDAQIDQINKQISAQTNLLSTQNKGMLAEMNALDVQIELVDFRIKKSQIKSPIAGIVLGKYAEKGELINYGKPLAKIAKLDTITLRAYVSGDQLSTIKIGDEVTIRVDTPSGNEKSYKGNIGWISSKAEFTPKIIQTKNERVNLVYAFKVLVPNDGALKIGMPAEVSFAEKVSL